MSEIYQCILSDALIWVNGETTSTVRGQLETATVLYTILILMTMHVDNEIFLWQYTSNPHHLKTSSRRLSSASLPPRSDNSDFFVTKIKICDCISIYVPIWSAPDTIHVIVSLGVCLCEFFLQEIVFEWRMKIAQHVECNR